MPMEMRAPPHYYYHYYYYYYYHHHHLIRTTTTTNNNNNKIIRNLILTKSFVNIIIFIYNTVPCFKEILWKYLTVLRRSRMFVLKFELILISGSNNVLTEGARKVYRGRRVGQGWFRRIHHIMEFLILYIHPCIIFIIIICGETVISQQSFPQKILRDCIRFSLLWT
jgi:hypothetical protein